MSVDYSQILVVDLEATTEETPGSARGKTEVIEVGYALVDARRHAIVRGGSIMVQPTTMKVTPFCTKLTTIRPEDVTVEAGAVSFREACAKVRELVENCLWASWGDYDRRQFERQCEAESVRYPFGPSHLNVKGLHALAYGLQAPVGMAAALEMMGRPLHGTHHRGVDDANNIAGILCVLLERLAYGTGLA